MTAVSQHAMNQVPSAKVKSAGVSWPSSSKVTVRKWLNQIASGSSRAEKRR